MLEALPGSNSGGASVDELSYFEALMAVFERINCSHAASRCAMAALKHIDEALTGELNREQRIKARGRLWSSVFTFCLEAETISS